MQIGRTCSKLSVSGEKSVLEYMQKSVILLQAAIFFFGYEECCFSRELRNEFITKECNDKW